MLYLPTDVSATVLSIFLFIDFPQTINTYLGYTFNVKTPFSHTTLRHLHYNNMLSIKIIF